MIAIQSPVLVVAGLGSFAAALAHMACIVGGARWYRAMGAGERMARDADQRRWRPIVITLLISAMLALWGVYAWSGAGLVPRLPLLGTALGSISTIYLARGLLFVGLKPYFRGNSPAFWHWSSAICVAMGCAYLTGLWQAWPHLDGA